MDIIMDKVDSLVESINNLRAKPLLPINTSILHVGSVVGKCINCGENVKLRQPWLSRMSEVKDGWFVVHCNNPLCHNYYGMDVKLSDLGYVDFVSWDKSVLLSEKSCRIIQFPQHRFNH